MLCSKVVESVLNMDVDIPNNGIQRKSVSKVRVILEVGKA